MRQTRSISTVVALTVITFTCQAQISTFPSPPPLAPSTDGTTSDSSNNRTPVSGGESIPDQTSGKSPVSAGSGTPSDHTAAPVPPAPITASTLTSMTALDDKVLLEAGDSISFRVIEDKDVAVPRIVTDTGEVDFPYIGRVKVEGKTCHQVAVEVKRLLEVDYYKRATVIVGLDLIIGQDKTKARDIAWVVGEVRQAGPSGAFQSSAHDGQPGHSTCRWFRRLCGPAEDQGHPPRRCRA